VLWMGWYGCAALCVNGRKFADISRQFDSTVPVPVEIIPVVVRTGL
jgi:hypothetical protein